MIPIGDFDRLSPGQDDRCALTAALAVQGKAHRAIGNHWHVTNVPRWAPMISLDALVASRSPTNDGG
jgi:hypothetical protein